MFTPPERERIAAAGDPDALMWTLWAAKETAYKVARKIDPLAASAPRLYPVVLFPGDPVPIRSGTVCGMVFSPCGPVAVRVTIATDYLHCIGATKPVILERVLWSVERYPPAEAGGDAASDISQTVPSETLCDDHSPCLQGAIKLRREERRIAQSAPFKAFDPSAAVRRHARRHLAELLHVSAADIEIQRLQDNDGWGPPRPYLNGKPAPFDLSLSHDGIFIAYAITPLFG